MAKPSKWVSVKSVYHHELLTSGLWNFFITNYHVDFGVSTSEGLVRAHQLILDVFLPPEKLDRNALVDQRSNLHSLLKFIYTGTVHVEIEELENLLWLGKQLNFQVLVDAVEAAMAETGSGSAGGGGGGKAKTSDATAIKQRRKQRRVPAEMSPADMELPIDASNQDKESLPRKFVSSVMLLVPDDNEDSPAAMDVVVDDSADDSSSSDDSNDISSSSDDSFYSENEDDGWSELDSVDVEGKGESELAEDESPETQFNKFVKQSETTVRDVASLKNTQICKAVARCRKQDRTVLRKRKSDGQQRIAVSKTTVLVESSASTDDLLKAMEKAATPVTKAATIIRRRQYMLTHPLIRCTWQDCQFSTRSTQYHQEHVDTVHAPGAKLFPCPTCQEPFLDEELMLHHQNYMHANGDGTTRFYQCQQCEYNTKHKVRYQVHMNRRHGEKDVAIYRCDLCARAFLHLDTLNRHKRSHKQYKCSHCDFAATKTWTFKYHLFSMHQVNEKGEPAEKLQCAECDYKGNHVYAMRDHIATRHTADKPYKCSFPLCSYASGRKGDRDKHYKIAHLQEKNYMCEFCSYRTVTPYNLEIHRRTHTGERPFQCASCPKKFVDSYSLKIHAKLHTKTETIFHCYLCNFTSNRRDILRTHMKGAHKKKQIGYLDTDTVEPGM